MKEKKLIKSIAQCCLLINTDELNVLIAYALIDIGYKYNF